VPVWWPERGHEIPIMDLLFLWKEGYLVYKDHFPETIKSLIEMFSNL
jgi:hypothetical protein